MTAPSSSTCSTCSSRSSLRSLPSRLVVMPEYSSSGLWCPRSDGTLDHPCPSSPLSPLSLLPVRECDPVQLGLSPALQVRFEKWCASYEHLKVGVPGHYPNLRPFAAEGRALALALGIEFPEVEVWYYDEALHDKGLPRRDYIYRVPRLG